MEGRQVHYKARGVLPRDALTRSVVDERPRCCTSFGSEPRRENGCPATTSGLRGSSTRFCRGSATPCGRRAPSLALPCERAPRPIWLARLPGTAGRLARAALVLGDGDEGMAGAVAVQVFHAVWHGPGLGRRIDLPWFFASSCKVGRLVMTWIGPLVKTLSARPPSSLLCLE
jgi:hypothetical protein